MQSGASMGPKFSMNGPPAMQSTVPYPTHKTQSKQKSDAQGKKQIVPQINMQKLAMITDKKGPSAALSSLRLANLTKPVVGINAIAKPKTGPMTPSASSVQNKLGQKKPNNLLFGEDCEPKASDRVQPKTRKEVSATTNYSPAMTPKINVPLNSLQNSIQIKGSPDQ